MESPLFPVAVAVIAAALALAWTRRLPATGVLVVANVAVLALEYLDNRVIIDLRLDALALQQGDVAQLLTLVTSAFTHAGFLHLFGNMLLLFILGNAFEERIGPRLIVVVYLATAIAGALTETALQWGDPLYLVGASGAVFGIIGAFAGAYPNLVVPMPLPLLIIMVFVRMRVWIGAVILGTVEYLYLMFYAFAPVAHGAHLGGLVSGILIGTIAIRRAKPARRPQPVDLKRLTPFAPDDATREALARMDGNSDEPAVFQAWLDRFFRTARCPTCQHRVMPHHRGEVVCTQGHRFDVRAQKPAKT